MVKNAREKKDFVTKKKKLSDAVVITNVCRFGSHRHC